MRVLAFVVLFFAVSFPAFASLGCTESELVAKYGEPIKELKPGKDDFWDKALLFEKEMFVHKFAVLAYLKDNKTRSIVYGYPEAHKPIGQSEILLLLNDNSNGQKWQKQVIREYYRLSWFRNDRQAFAFYDGQDARPSLNVMDSALWEQVSRMRKKKPGQPQPATASSPDASTTPDTAPALPELRVNGI